MQDQDKDLSEYLAVDEVAVLHLNLSVQWSPRYKAVVRGWCKPYYIIMDRPKYSGRLVHMQKNDSCVVRFLSEGKACGFNSTVMDFDSRIVGPTCLITWPKHIEVLTFRKYKRVRIFAPCQFSLENTVHEGEVQDVSVSGCRVLTPERIMENARIELTFTLPDGVPIEKIHAIVRNVQYREGTSLVGCEFAEGQQHLQSDIAFLAGSLLQRTAGSENAPRVLIVDESDARAMDLRAVFEARGWLAFTTSNSVEGLLRLRMIVPSALLISDNQKDLPGLQLLDLLKTTRGMESVPVFIYGGEESHRVPALAAGAAGFFASNASVDQICIAVAGQEEPEDLVV